MTEDDEGGGVEELRYTQGPSPGTVDPQPLSEEQQELVDAQIAEEQWEEESVRQHLLMVGEGIHEVWGVAEKDWEMSSRDLNRIAPPLTRILNRYQPTRAVAEYSDPVLLGWGSFMYASRSVLQAKAAKLKKQEEEEGVWPLEEEAGYDVPDGDEPEQQIPREHMNGLRFPQAARRNHR